MIRARLIASLLAVVSTGSLAQSSVYIAAGLGVARVESDITNQSQVSGNLVFTQSADTKATAFGLLVGRNFNSQWSLEGGYLNIRSLSANESIVATNAVVQGNVLNGSISLRQEISGYALTLTPRFTHRIGAVDLFVRAGLAHVKVENEVTLSGSGTVNGNPASATARQTFKDNSTVPMVGIGAQFFATRNIAVRGDYTYISKVGDRATTGESSINLFMISGVYQF
jgi:opacity protein-like surface antigen